jgi:hypothetical protein
MKNKSILGILFVVVFPIISWIANLMQFCNLDFQPTYKLEIIKGIGIVIPWWSMVSVWF